MWFSVSSVIFEGIFPEVHLNQCRVFFSLPLPKSMVAHRGHAANKIIAVILLKLQKLYYYCSNYTIIAVSKVKLLQVKYKVAAS
jgi:hypothetical protein